MTQSQELTPGAAPKVAVLTDERQALEAARAVAELAAKEAVSRDRARIYPLEALSLFSRLGLGSISVPREFGGGGLSYRTITEVFRLISSVDPSLGQIPQNHFGLIQYLRDEGTYGQQKSLFKAVVEGQRFGNGGPEKNTRHTREVLARLRQRPDGLRLSGEKFYSTGALFAHIVVTTAVDDQGKAVLAFIPQPADGLEVIDDWSGFGQRTGQLAARLQAGDALLQEAGEVVDLAQLDPHEQSVAAASVSVATVRAWTTEVALEAGNLLFELSGTRSALREHNLDRHWRNARTHTLHDPVRWKYPVIGNYVLNGVLPPRRGTL